MVEMKTPADGISQSIMLSSLDQTTSGAFSVRHILQMNPTYAQGCFPAEQEPPSADNLSRFLLDYPEEPSSYLDSSGYSSSGWGVVPAEEPPLFTLPLQQQQQVVLPHLSSGETFYSSRALYCALVRVYDFLVALCALCRLRW